MKLLGFDYSEGGEWQHRLNQWDRFSLQGFVLVKQQGSVVGCLCPWSPSHVRSLVVHKASLGFRALGAAMPLLGRPWLSPGKSIAITYLTHFEVSHELNADLKEQVVTEMLRFFFRHHGFRGGKHLVSLSASTDLDVRPSLASLGLLSREVGTVLFHCTSKGNHSEHARRENTPLGFEAAIS